MQFKIHKPNPNLREDDNRSFWTISAMATYGGSFVKSLAECFSQADFYNFNKLKGAFPELWSEYEGVGKELEKQSNEI